MSSTVLEEYIETGNHYDLDLLLSKRPELLNELTSHSISALLLSCYYHKEQITNTILKHSRAINIHEACAIGMTDQVGRMIQQKPTVIAEISTHGFTPLGIATHFGRTEVVRLLLRHQADPNISSQNGNPVFPLHTSIAANYEAITRLLLDAGAAVNLQQHGGVSALHLAAQQGHISLIILLLEHGAQLGTLTQSGHTAAALALDKGYTDIAQILKVD